jgi:Condensation domain
MENPATAGFWLSPQQRHIWALQQKGYAYRGSCFVLIEGAVCADDMERCLRLLVARHEILRTVYLHQAGMKFPFQVVLDSVNPAFEAVDLRSSSQSEQCGRLEKLLLDEQVQSAGPEAGPVLTAKFATLGTNRSALVFSVPAMSADRSSLQVLVRDLEQFVTGSAATSTEEPLRYVQFAQWQNDLAEGQYDISSKGREFWTNSGEADPALVLPNESKREAGFSLQLIAEPLDDATWTGLTSLAGKVESETVNSSSRHGNHCCGGSPDYLFSKLGWLSMDANMTNYAS